MAGNIRMGIEHCQCGMTLLHVDQLNIRVESRTEVEEEVFALQRDVSAMTWACERDWPTEQVVGCLSWSRCNRRLRARDQRGDL